MLTPDKKILESFEEKFPMQIYAIREHLCIHPCEKTPCENVKDSAAGKEIKEFILNALSSQRAELKKEIKKMKIKNPKCDCRIYSMGEHNCDITSNAAIADILALLNETP